MLPYFSETPRIWDNFDLQSSTTLYWKAINCLLKQPDREEQAFKLTVRVLMGVNRSSHNSRVSPDCHPGNCLYDSLFYFICLCL